MSDKPDRTALEVLVSIETILKQVLAVATAAAPKRVAPAREIDGPHGDPKVTLNPRDWHGGSFKGQRMSDCPADFLEVLAETYDYFAQQAEATGETWNNKPVAPYKRADASRARGWAARKRAGWQPPSVQEAAPGLDPEDPESSDGGAW